MTHTAKAILERAWAGHLSEFSAPPRFQDQPGSRRLGRDRPQAVIATGDRIDNALTKGVVDES